MILLDLFMTNDMLLHYPESFEIEDLGVLPFMVEESLPSSLFWIYYGEPEVYPQFATAEAHVLDRGLYKYYLERTEATANWALFFIAKIEAGRELANSVHCHEVH